MTYTLPNWQDSPSTATPTSAANLLTYNAAINDIDTRINGKQSPLVIVGPKTAGYTANPGELVLVDTTSGGVTVTLPTAPADKTQVGVKQVVQGGTNTVGLALGGSDRLNTTTGPTSATLYLLNQGAIFEYVAATAVWVTVSTDVPLSQLDLRYVGASSAIPQSQVTGLSTVLNPSYAAGGQWAPNVYGTQFENMERDDATGTYLMVTGFKTVLVLLGLCPAGTYSSFKLYVTTAGTSSTLTTALYSASSLTSTSWARLGSGNVTAAVTPVGLSTTSLAFTLASPAYVVLQMVLTTASTFPAFAATPTGTPIALLNPVSGCPVTGTLNASSAPGATLNPTTGFTNIGQKIWCALA